MIRLSILEAAFLGSYSDAAGAVTFQHGVAIDAAQGVHFVCPKCGNHAVICWFLNPRAAIQVPNSAFPRPARWSFSGTSIEDLTLTPSVDLSIIDEDNPASPGRCYWHGFVTAGEAG